MQLPGQTIIKVNGKPYHFYFGLDTTAEFLHMNRRLVKVDITQKTDKKPKFAEEMRDLSLNDFAKPFFENETKALMDMFYCALQVGDTAKDLPPDLDRQSFGRWLDQADEGAVTQLLAAYMSSKPLGK